MAAHRKIRSQIEDMERILAETKIAQEKEKRAREELEKIRVKQERLQDELKQFCKEKEGVQEDLKKLREEEAKKQIELERINKGEDEVQEKLNRLDVEKEKIQNELRAIKGGAIAQRPIRKIRKNWGNDIEDNLNNGDIKYRSQVITITSLSSVVKAGDYVNYPVNYENVECYGKRKASFSGWRVLDIADGYVRLVSGGIPLTINDNSDSKIINTRTGNAFIDTQMGEFASIGFTDVKGANTLTEIFDNPYTFAVNALSLDDIDRVLKRHLYNDERIRNDNNGLLVIGASYYLAWPYHDLGVITNSGMLKEYWLLYKRGIRPVVTLKSEVYTSGKDENGVWQLYMPH